MIMDRSILRMLGFGVAVDDGRGIVIVMGILLSDCRSGRGIDHWVCATVMTIAVIGIMEIFPENDKFATCMRAQYRGIRVTE